MRKTTCFYILLLLFLLSLCSSLTSCATKPKVEYITTTETVTEVVTETQYVPTYTDLTDTVLAIISLRPDNSQYTVKTDEQLKTVWDVMSNSWSYQCAWEDWQAYAETLEGVLIDIRDTIADPETELEPINPADYGAKSENLGNYVTVTEN